jgi:predicted permease
LVLLIAIANVANLLLAKGSSRQRELSIRIALGAGARRVVSQLISESAVLGLIGGGFGLLIASVGTDALTSMVPANIPRLHSAEMDWRVFLFAFGVSILSGIVFGAAPAFFALHVNVNDGLKEGGRSGMQGRQHRYVRTGFVVAQFSLALMLLIGAGLLIRSFKHVLEVDPGFQAANVVSASVSLPSTTYKEPVQKRAFHLELMRRLETTPGVQSVGAATDLPLEGNWTKIFSVEGQVPPPGAGLNMDSHSIVLNKYFQALGIPLVRGRFFTDADDLKSTKVVIINKTLADRYFHGQDPIGHRLKWGPPESESPWLTIVGVVGDVKEFDLEKNVRPHTYENYQQYSSLSDVRVVIRSQGDPQAATSALQSAVHSLDSQLPITEVRTMSEVMSESTAPRRFYLILITVFAVAAIILASVGLYGMVAFAVEQRTREIGIRMTLGATQQNVLALLLRWALMLVMAGIVAGTIGAMAVTHLMTAFLYGTKPMDPLTFVGVPLLLGGVALLASYIPARRATKVDPMVALRYE